MNEWFLCPGISIGDFANLSCLLKKRKIGEPSFLIDNRDQETKLRQSAE